MADNYIERRMEQHRASQSISASKVRRGLPFPRTTVYITDICQPVAQALASLLAPAGCLVAASAPDPAKGIKAAQACGARFYPHEIDRSLDTLLQSGDRPDAIVAFDSDPAHSLQLPSDIYKVSVITPSSSRSADTTALVPDMLTVAAGDTPLAAAWVIAAAIQAKLPPQIIRL